MGQYIIFINNSFTSLTGEEFKLLYFIAMTMASEEAEAMEISIGWMMDVFGKSERTMKRLVNKLVEKDCITYSNGLYSLNIDFESIEEEEPDEEKPKKVGFI